MKKRPFQSVFVWLICLLWLAACTPAWKRPVPLEQIDLSARAVSKTHEGVTVTAAVPTREQTKALFGTSLYGDKIQPVWFSVDNRSDRAYILMRGGVDPDHFSPLEASYQRHSGSKQTRREMDLFFHSMAFRNPAPPGEVTSGFVFTNLDEGFKAINVDLVSTRNMLNFSMVVEVPGLVTDMSMVDFDSIYPGYLNVDDTDELISLLEALPCCTTNKKGDRNGDPLNLVFVGDREQMFAALIRRGWHATEVTYRSSAWKTIKSFFFGSSYRYSPISPLYVFGRPQDIGLQKARNSIHLRNHMRVWRTPYLYQGHEVYIGQISRDVGVKFNRRTITTHAIDPDVDDTRDALIGDLAMIGALGKMHEWEIHCRGALNNGVSQEEVRAIIHVIGIYCGVPQALECFRVARRVLEGH